MARVGVLPSIKASRRCSSRLFSTTMGDCYARLSGRSLLQVKGHDSVKFLQGLITNNMSLVASGRPGLFTTFLNSKGRLVADALIYNQHPPSNALPAFLIECDSEVLPTLHSDLKRFILRSRVTVDDVSDQFDVWHLWGPSVMSFPKSQTLPSFASELTSRTVVLRDPRLESLGMRVLQPTETDLRLPGSFAKVDAEEYHLNRMVNGIPEGPKDFVPTHSLPLESNIDLMNGVDFHKGCYVGQELTIRSYHHGVIRKRIVPVVLSPEPLAPSAKVEIRRDLTFDLPPPHSNIDNAADPKKRRSKFCSGMHNIGLALVYLETLDLPPGKLTMLTVDQKRIYLHPFRPSWWPPPS